MIHIAEAQSVTLKFPRKCSSITELFSGRKYSDTDHIGITADGPETLLFRYE